jgi:hypothetical protein
VLLLCWIVRTVRRGGQGQIPGPAEKGGLSDPQLCLVHRPGQGDAPVTTQLTWCDKFGVPEAVIPHCGTQIVDGDERRILPQLRRWARRRGLEATIAHDGMQRVL